MQLAKHRIQVNTAEAVGTVKLGLRVIHGIEAEAVSEGPVWAIYFDAPEDTDLDFLRPDILPPK